jgi:sugar lactone lactonase YvrE
MAAVLTAGLTCGNVRAQQLYVANSDTFTENGTVCEVTSEGNVTILASGFSDPMALAFASGGNLFISNFDRQASNSILEMTPDGNVSTYAPNVTDATDMSFDANGTLFVTDYADGQVEKIGSDGNVTNFVTGLGHPAALAFDGNGTLYVADTGNNSIYKVTPGGSVRPFVTGISGSAVAFDATGNLYAADTDNGTVYRVTPSGNIGTFATGFGLPDGLAFDASGNLYVANFYNGTISKITPGGNVSNFAKGFYQPTGLAFAPAVVGSLAIGNATIISGHNTTVTVKLTTPAPVGGANVILSSDSPEVMLPASVFIPAYGSSASVTLTTATGISFVTANISATYNGITQAQVVMVASTLTPQLKAVNVQPGIVVGGLNATGVVTVMRPAASNATVKLTSSNAAVSVPSAVTVPAGSTSAEFIFKTNAVASKTMATVAATYGNRMVSSMIMANPIPVQSLALSSYSIKGGQQVTGTVTLTLPAAPGNVIVSLTTGNSALIKLSTQSLTFSNGEKSNMFTLTAGNVKRTTVVQVQAMVKNTNIRATVMVTINPAA